jgi:hypothetical protein
LQKTEKQIAEFEQAARELETDDDEKRFNEKLGKIAKAKPGALLATRERPKSRHEPSSAWKRPPAVAVAAAQPSSLICR